MLGAEEVAQVERLLAEGASQRAAAARLRLARGTVATIARGRHPRQRGRPDSAARGDRLQAGRRRGRLRVREFLAAAAELIEPLGVELRGAALARYRRLREERLRQEADGSRVAIGDAGRRECMLFW